MRHTSLPPLPSSTRRSRQFIHNKDSNDILSTIRNNYNDNQDENSESDNEPLWRPSRNAMWKRPSKHSFLSTLGEQVTATQLTLMSAQPLRPEGQEVYIVSEEEDEREPVSLASKTVSDSAYE